MNPIATEFLTRCFAPGETIALLLRNGKTAKTQQRIVKIETATAPHYLSWLSHENRHGSNIYVSANPLLAGSRKRTKDSIASVRHLYLDIDVDGETSLSALRSLDLVPQPTAILGTSSGKYQLLWRVDGFDFSTQEMTLKLLAIAFGGDIACTDCNRVLRVPGFVNCKYDPPWPVAVRYASDATYRPQDFRLNSAPITGMTVRSRAQTMTPQSLTHSERDWAWVSREVARGRQAVEITFELASRRSDKPNPMYYAQRTVDMASARLWLTEGRSVAHVIAALEDRRCLEIPIAICSARAQEIATTAQRMIARRKIA